MATDKVILRENFKSGENLKEKQFYLGTLTETSTVVLATSGSIAYPIDEGQEEHGETTLALGGVAIVLCAGEIKQGARVAPNNEGKAQEWASGQYAVGVALEKGESGVNIPILLPAPPKA